MNSDRAKRILLGTVDTGLMDGFAKGLRALGHQVTTANFTLLRPSGIGQYDVEIGPDSPCLISWPAFIEDSSSLLIRIPRGFINRAARIVQFTSLIRKHDIFFFQFGNISLTSGNREYWLLKYFGKKIIAAFMGGEVRNIHAYKSQYGSDSVTAELEADCKRRTGHDPFSQMQALRMAELYANVIFSQPNQSSLAIRPYYHLFIPLLVGEYKHCIPARDVPVVVHAPSSRATKGTTAILAAVDRLKREGVDFEFRLLERMSNDIIRDELANADILIDQLFFNYHGKLTLEALASGCAVASSNNERFEPFPKNRPIWHIDQNNIFDQLKVLFESKELRMLLAHAGRPYVQKFHDHVEVARRIMNRLETNDNNLCDHRPTFFIESYCPSDSQPISRRLQNLTARVIRKYGHLSSIDPTDFVRREIL